MNYSTAAHAEEMAYVERDWNRDDRGIRDRVMAYRLEGQTLWNAIHVRAQEDHRYAGGQQYPADVEKYARSKGLPRLVIDKVTPLIDTMVSRLSMRRFRPAIISDRVELAAVAEPLDLAMGEMRRRGRAEFATEDAFRDLWTTGIGVIQILTYWRNSRVPKLRYDAIPLWEIMVDPLCREQNFQDRTWHQRHRFYTHPQLMEMYGTVPGFANTFQSYYEMWKEAGGTQDGHWPTALESSWRTSSEGTDQVAMTTTEWREVEPYYEITLDPELDALVLQRLLDGGDQPGEEQLFVALRESILQVAGLATDAATREQLATDGPVAVPRETSARPQEMAERPWKLSKEGYERFLRVWNVAGLAPFTGAWEGERDAFYYADTVGDLVVVKTGRIPENFWRVHFLTDVMVRQPEGHLPRCYVRGVQDRQDFYNQTISGMLEMIAGHPKALMVTENMFDQSTEAENNLARPRHIVQARKPLTPDNIREPTPPRVEAYVHMHQVADQIQSEETMNPYEAGGTGSTGSLSRTAFRAISTLTEASQEKHASRFNALRRFHVMAEAQHLIRILSTFWDWDDIVRMVGVDKITAEQVNPETGQPEQIMLFPRDRRAWMEVLDYGVDLDEKEVTVNEAEDRFHKLFLDQGGLLAAFGGRPEFPEPKVLAESLPDALASVLGARGARLYHEQLKKLQDMIDNPQPPPGQDPPPQQ